MLRVREELLSVLQPEQAHARALRGAALQVRVLQQGERSAFIHLFFIIVICFRPVEVKSRHLIVQ